MDFISPAVKDVLASVATALAVAVSASLSLSAEDVPVVAQTSPNRGGGSVRPSITPLMKSWSGRGIRIFVADKVRCALLLSDDDGGGDLNTADADVDDDELVEAAVADAAAAVVCCRNGNTQTSTRNENLGTRDLRDACNI